jgi:LPXTG-motif cell wall-anchored protein
MNKLTVFAGTTAVALVVAATAATPAFAYQNQHSDKSSYQHSSQYSSPKKNCPPKKTEKPVEAPKKDCPPKKTPVKHTHKPCPPKHVEKPTPKPTPTPVKPVEAKPVQKVEQPKTLPNTGASDVLFPAAGLTGVLGYAGNVLRLKRKALR